MRYVGIDAHKDYSYVAELGEDSKFLRYRVEHTEVGLAEYVKGLGPDVEAVIEASTSTFSLHDLIKPFVAKVVVGHPAQTRGAAAHHVKTDRHDAEILARLLKVGFISSVRVPNPAQRALRNITEHRVALSEQRVAITNRLRALLRQEMVRPPVLDLFQGSGRTFLDRLAWSEPLHRVVADSLLAGYDAVTAQLKQTEDALVEFSRQSPETQLLMTIPGLGSILASQVVAQVGDVKRFASPRQLGAYAGLVPRVVSSGKTSYKAGISRRSRTLLRTALCLAVCHTVRRPGGLQRFHQKLCERRPRAVAKVACAHKLLTIIWHMLQTQEPYRDQDVALTNRKMKALGIS